MVLELAEEYGSPYAVLATHEISYFFHVFFLSFSYFLKIFWAYMLLDTLLLFQTKGSVVLYMYNVDRSEFTFFFPVLFCTIELQSSEALYCYGTVALLYSSFPVLLFCSSAGLVEKINKNKNVLGFKKL